VKITTAPEPEGGKGKRGELDEVLAQADEGVILELSEAACFARHVENFQATRVTGMLVAAEGAR